MDENGEIRWRVLRTCMYNGKVGREEERKCKGECETGLTKGEGCQCRHGAYNNNRSCEDDEGRMIP